MLGKASVGVLYKALFRVVSEGRSCSVLSKAQGSIKKLFVWVTHQALLGCFAKLLQVLPWEAPFGVLRKTLVGCLTKNQGVSQKLHLVVLCKVPLGCFPGKLL